MGDVIKIGTMLNSNGDELMMKSHATAVKINNEHTLATKLVEVVQGINARVKKTELEAVKGELTDDITSLKNKMQTDISDLESNVNDSMGELQSGLSADISSLESTMNETMSDSYAELSGSIEALNDNLDAHLVEQEENFDAIHEALSAKVETSTFDATLEELNSEIALLAKSTDVTAEITSAIDSLIDGAPGTYDTLREIAVYISENENTMEALNAAIGAKAEKTEVEALQVLIDALGSLSKKNVVTAADLDVELAGAIDNIDTKASIADLDAARSELERQISVANTNINTKADISELNATKSELEKQITAVSGDFSGLGDLANKDVVTESDLDDALKAKIEAGITSGGSSGGFVLSDGTDEDSWEPGNLVFVYNDTSDKLAIE